MAVVVVKLLLSTVAFLLVFGRLVPVAAQERFLLLATDRADIMREELGEAGAADCEAAFGSGFGGGEAVVVLERDPEGRRSRYILLATSSTHLMQDELGEVPDDFVLVGLTVFRSVFGGKEIAAILHAPAASDLGL